MSLNNPPTRRPSSPAVPETCVPTVTPLGPLGDLSPELPRNGRVPNRVPGDAFDGLGRLTEPYTPTADSPVSESESILATAAQPEPPTPILEPHTADVAGRAEMPPLSSKPSRPRPSFTPEDEYKLLDLKVNKNRTWKEIAALFPGRSVTLLQSRYYYKLKHQTPQTTRPTSGLSTENLPTKHASRSPKLPRRTWTTEEDAHILGGVAQGGSKIWIRISRGLEGRSTRICKSRYYKTLIKERSGQIPVSQVQALLRNPQQSNPLTIDLNATCVAFRLVVDSAMHAGSSES